MKTLEFKQLTESEKQNKLKSCLAMQLPSLSLSELELVINARVNFREGKTPLANRQWTLKVTDDLELFYSVLLLQTVGAAEFPTLKEVGTWLIGGGEFGSINDNNIINAPGLVKRPDMTQLVAIVSVSYNIKTDYFDTRFQLFGYSPNKITTATN